MPMNLHNKILLFPLKQLTTTNITFLYVIRLIRVDRDAPHKLYLTVQFHGLSKMCFLKEAADKLWNWTFMWNFDPLWFEKISLFNNSQLKPQAYFFQ